MASVCEPQACIYDPHVCCESFVLRLAAASRQAACMSIMVSMHAQSRARDSSNVDTMSANKLLRMRSEMARTILNCATLYGVW